MKFTFGIIRDADIGKAIESICRLVIETCKRLFVNEDMQSKNE